MSQQQSFGETGSVPGIPGIETVTGNDGLAAAGSGSPVNINIVGNTTQGVHVTRTAADTETITIDDATTSQKGVLTLATNAETIAGTVTTKATTPDDIKAKLGTQTLHGLAYGNATTGALQWLAEAANGQIPIGSTGNAPVLANITSLDGSVTITNGPGTIDLKVTETIVSGTGTTIGTSTADLITFPLGATPGTFQFEARVKGFEATTPAGAGYNLYATFTTDGATATLVGVQDVFNVNAVLNTASATFVASGNNAVLRVQGVTALTINWSAETQVT